MIKKIKNKKAISPMIGYILLISAAIFMSVIVYSWLKTYVPKSAMECPDTTSLFIKEHSYILNDQLNITIQNNGNFNVTGYFIKAANKSGQKLATIDLSKKLLTQFGGLPLGNSVSFSPLIAENAFSPNDETEHVFNVSNMNQIYFIELTAIRIQENDGSIIRVSCANSKIKEELN